MRLPGKDVIEALDAFRILCPSPGSHLDFTHETALKIAGEHGYEICEALIVAAALEAGCAILYSEDLQHAQVWTDRSLDAKALPEPAVSFPSKDGVDLGRQG